MKRPSPAELRRQLPEAAAPIVDAVLLEADAREVCVYLVGGPVRDLLLGRSVVDVDLIVERKDGIGAADLVQAAAPPESHAVRHDRFGTVTLRTSAASVDVATVRRETYAYPGALPSVEDGTLEEDLQRRDFTVNALALPLSQAARARHRGIVDFEGGLRDLEEGRLRVLHPKSFEDDPTRALRAARLAPRLSFSLSRGSRAALRDALRAGACGRVSGDRLRRELVKLFEDPVKGLDPSRALRLLDGWHVLGALEPGLHLPGEAVAPLRRLGRAVAAPPWRPGRFRPWVAGLSLWLAPLDAGLRRRALVRFAVRGETAERIGGAAASRAGWLRALERARGRGAVDALLAELDEEALYALYAWAGPGPRRRLVRYANEDRGRRLPVGGEELLAIGLAGPAVGEALRRIRSAYLDGAVRTREESLALARELLRGRPRRRPRGRGARE